MQDSRRTGIGASRPEKPFFAFKYPRGACEAERRELRGFHAGFRSMARMQMFRHRAGFKKLPEPRRLAACIAEGIHRGPVVEAEKEGRRHGRTERTAGRSIVPDTIMRGSDGHPDTCCGFETVENGSKKLASSFCVPGGKRPCSGNNNAPGMHDGLPVKVVGFQNMAERSQQKRGPVGVGYSVLSRTGLRP